MNELPRPAAPRAKRGRISRSAEFERVYRRGRSWGSRHLVLHVFPRPGDEPAEAPRLGLSVSRRVGGAVERNLVKRLLREAWAQEACTVPTDHDVVLVARADLRELAEREGLAGVRRSLAKLLADAAQAAPR